MNSSLTPELHHRWNTLCRTLGISAVMHTPVLADLLQRYAEPHRHYHTREHLLACLREFDLHRKRLDFNPPDNAAMGLAFWFHDAVYDPKRQDNEEQSADLCGDECEFLAIDRDIIGLARFLIRETTHDHQPGLLFAEWFCDIDLKILGEPWQFYSSYAATIRREYGFVPEAEYGEGRSYVLQSFLDRPYIYATTWYRDRYEAAARANLQQELLSLTATFSP